MLKHHITIEYPIIFRIETIQTGSNSLIKMKSAFKGNIILIQWLDMWNEWAVINHCNIVISAHFRSISHIISEIGSCKNSGKRIAIAHKHTHKSIYKKPVSPPVPFPPISHNYYIHKMDKNHFHSISPYNKIFASFPYFKNYFMGA